MERLEGPKVACSHGFSSDLCMDAMSERARRQVRLDPLGRATGADVPGRDAKTAQCRSCACCRCPLLLSFPAVSSDDSLLCIAFACRWVHEYNIGET